MIKIEFDPQNLTPEKKAEWEGLIAKAKEATSGVIAEWERWRQRREEWLKAGAQPDAAPKFDPNWKERVWKDFRDFLLVHVFHNKCAYCETKINRFLAHTEHFRPKGQVRYKQEGAESSQTAKVEFDDDEFEHPGYFWLAYNWKNLLPSCQFCNAVHGKKDFFPIEGTYVAVKRLTPKEVQCLSYQIIKSSSADDIYYLEPEDLNVLESPLLLNPYNPKEDPREHIQFGAEGKAAPRKGSAKGKVSIELFALNDDPEIVKQRHREQTIALTDYMDKIKTVRDSVIGMRRAAEDVLEEYRKGERPYAAAVFDYLHIVFRGSDLDPDKPFDKVIAEQQGQTQ